MRPFMGHDVFHRGNTAPDGDSPISLEMAGNQDVGENPISRANRDSGAASGVLPAKSPRVPKGWRVVTVRIDRIDGTVTESPGIVHPSAPGLSVTKAVGPDRRHAKVVITHTGSGLKLFGFKALKRACRGVLVIAPLADWTLTSQVLRGMEGLSTRAYDALSVAGVPGVWIP